MAAILSWLQCVKFGPHQVTRIVVWHRHQTTSDSLIGLLCYDSGLCNYMLDIKSTLYNMLNKQFYWASETGHYILTH